MTPATTAARTRAANFSIGLTRRAAIFALGGLLAALVAGCGGGGGGSSSPSGPTAPGLPTTPTSGDFNDLVLRLDPVAGGYTVTKLAAEANSAVDTKFGAYAPGNANARTQIWLDGVPNGTTAAITSPTGLFIDTTGDPTAVSKGEAGIWYSEAALNSDGYAHVLVLQRSTIYYVCFEDAKLPHDDSHLKEPTLKQILAADGATFDGNTVAIDKQTF